MVDSVWIKSKVTATAVKVRNKTLEWEQDEDHDTFVANALRAVRNAHHGYFTDGDKKNRRPSRYLFMLNGDLPIEITVLPSIWFLALVADPERFISWKTLGIGKFEI